MKREEEGRIALVLDLPGISRINYSLTAIFKILIQLSNADLDVSLCVYPHPPTDSTCKPENPSYKFWSVFLSRTALFCCSLCSEYGWKLLALIILSIPFELC